MMQINNALQPKDLASKIQHFWQLSGDKITLIEKSYNPAEGAPVFTRNGVYTSQGWTDWTHQR